MSRELQHDMLYASSTTASQSRQTEGQEQDDPEDESGQCQEDADRQNHQAPHRHSLPFPPL